MGYFVSKYIPVPLQRPALWSVRKIVSFIHNAVFLRKIFYLGFTFYCPVCKSRLRCFQPLVTQEYTRLTAKRCPVCNSLERHRWIWLFLKKKTDFFNGKPKKMLHIAPEKALSRHFPKMPSLNYLSGDIEPNRAMEKIDITNIQYPDKSFDIIYCSHVLEHVPNDRQAIREFYRVLKDKGWALIVVPMLRETTFEDFSITDPQERYRVFGLSEHVRICGKDYKDRFTSAGFSIDLIEVSDVLNEKQIKRFGLLKEPILFCKK